MNISALTKKSLALLEGVDNLEQLKKAHKDLLGKNGEVNLLLKKLGTLPPSKRKSHGKDLNNLKNQLEEIFQFKLKNLKKDSSELITPKLVKYDGKEIFPFFFSFASRLKI